MGLNKKGNNVTFLNIGDGKISKKVSEPTADSVTRTTKEGKTVHEELYGSFDGFITDIKVTTHQQYGKFWNIHLEDDGDEYTLQMNYSGGYASSFLKALPNVDFRQIVKLAPYVKTVNDKKRVSLYINQGGETVQWYFTKDEPNGLPPMVQVKVKGEMVWDDTDMMEFLEKYVNEKILPKIKNAVRMEGKPVEAAPSHKGKTTAPVGAKSLNDDVADDLPF